MANRAIARAKQLVESKALVAPVPVEAVVNTFGLQVVRQKFDGSVSAMLYRYEDSSGVVGVNSTHHRLRQRFSIAHELGHYLLHPGRPLIVDGVRVSFRNEESSMATQPEEIEANQFAAELLMPSDQVRANSLTHFDNEAHEVQKLASIFDVSKDAMRFRLVNLGLHSVA